MKTEILGIEIRTLFLKVNKPSGYSWGKDKWVEGRKEGKLQQGWTNERPQAKSDPMPVFVNKVLLGHNHAHLFIDYL